MLFSRQWASIRADWVYFFIKSWPRPGLAWLRWQSLEQKQKLGGDGGDRAGRNNVLLHTNWFSFGSFEIQIDKQQFRAGAGSVSWDDASLERGGYLQFISKLLRKLNIFEYLSSGMHFVCTSCQKNSYILAIDVSHGWPCSYWPLIVHPAEELAVPVVAAVDEGAVALGAEETLLVPGAVR